MNLRELFGNSKLQSLIGSKAQTNKAIYLILPILFRDDEFDKAQLPIRAKKSSYHKRLLINLLIFFERSIIISIMKLTLLCIFRKEKGRSNLKWERNIFKGYLASLLCSTAIIYSRSSNHVNAYYSPYFICRFSNVMWRGDGLRFTPLRCILSDLNTLGTCPVTLLIQSLTACSCSFQVWWGGLRLRPLSGLLSQRP